MNKIQKTVGWLVMAAVLTIVMTACSNDGNIANEPKTTTEAAKTYTMTVNATMGGEEAANRALSIDGTGALNATWTAGDKVAVLKLTGSLGSEHWELLGELTVGSVSADRLSCTLTGSFTDERIIAAGTPTVGSYLRLIYPGTRATTNSYSISYTEQDGTLSKIATDYDYCSTSGQKTKAVTVTAVDDGGNIITTPATFTNNQAIVRFTLTDPNGDPIYPTSLTISAKSGVSESLVIGEDLTGEATSGTGTLTINLDGSTNVVYVALRGFSSKDVTLTVDGTDFPYTYQKKGVTFTNGKYYTINVKMGGNKVNLAELSADYTASNGDVLTGTLPSGKHVVITDGAKVMLYNATISATTTNGIVCLGNASIILKGTNNVMTTSEGCAAIQAGGSGTTLAISGSGTLMATGGNGSAGIGSNRAGTCGNITISSGTVTATGGNQGAGIGTGRYYDMTSPQCGNITITGGTVNATGGAYGEYGAAGIGCGYGGICGNITISGARITATKGIDEAYSIGKSNGNQITCGTITIGGMVYYDGTNFQNGGDIYLATSPFTYQP